MELPSKVLEQIAFNTRPKIEEQMFIIMDKSIHEEPLPQPFQTNNEQFTLAVTFLPGYNGIFSVTDKNNKFYFAKSITDDGFLPITLSPGAYEIESLNFEIKRIIIDEEHFTGTEHPFTTKPIFSTLGSIIEVSRQGTLISFLPNDSLRNFYDLMQLHYIKNITFHPIQSTYYPLIKFTSKVISLKE